jgi:hypothetical protein
MKKLIFSTITLVSFGLLTLISPINPATASTPEQKASNAGNSTKNTLEGAGNGAKDTLHGTGKGAKNKMEGAGRVPYRGMKKFFTGK